MKHTTVMRRLGIYFHSKGLPFEIPIEKKKELGVLVFDAVKKVSPKKYFYGRVEQKEPEGVFKVFAYPVEFIPEIDKVIQDFMKPKRGRPRKVKASVSETADQPVKEVV